MTAHDEVDAIAPKSAQALPLTVQDDKRCLAVRLVDTGQSSLDFGLVVWVG